MPTLSYSKVTDAGGGWTRVETTDGRSLTVKGDRAMRNNNPGNIEYGNFAKSHGAIGTDGRFAVFPDRQTGIKAQSSLLFDKPSYRGLTLAQAISRYAPEFENNTKAYAATVAAVAGVSLDTKMEDIPADKRTAVLEAMHGVEGNTAAKAYDAETGEFVTTVDARPSRFADEMAAPQTRQQAMALDTVAHAYNDPMRALDTVPSAGLSLPPDRPMPTGTIQRSALAPATPSSFPSRPGVVGSLPAAAQPSSFPARPEVPGALPGRPPSSFPSRPAGPIGGMPAAALQSSFPSRPEVPGSLPAAKGPSTASLAEQYGSYRSPTGYAATARQVEMNNAAKPAPTGAPTSIAGNPNVSSLESALGIRSELENIKDDAWGPVAPSAMPTPPALTAPAPTVAAPPLAPPTVVQPRPVYQAPTAPVAPPAPPAARAYDVYSGMARSALDNTGMNTIGRLDDGTTTVTNQYGKTTGMTPGGYQTAVGSGAISGPLGQGGISTPSVPSMGGFFSKAGSMAKAAAPSVAGSTVGGLLGGPMGAILGAALAREATKPGGIFSGTHNVNTSALSALGFGPTTAFHNAVAGGRFPGAPANPGTTRGFKDSATRDHAYGMSPAAARDIDRGLGGLF